MLKAQSELRMANQKTLTYDGVMARMAKEIVPSTSRGPAAAVVSVSSKFTGWCADAGVAREIARANARRGVSLRRIFKDYYGRS
jgi:hypothetical protein